MKVLIFTTILIIGAIDNILCIMSEMMGKSQFKGTKIILSHHTDRMKV